MKNKIELKTGKDTLNVKELKNIKEYEDLYYYKYEKYSFEVISKTMIFDRLTKNIDFENKRVLEKAFGKNSLVMLTNFGTNS